MSDGRSHPGGLITVPALRRAFYGVTHQFAANEATVALTAGQVGAADTVLIDATYDFVAQARAAIWSPVTGGQGKVLLFVDRAQLFDNAIFLSAFGTGQYPQYLLHPLRIRGGSTFKVVIDDRQTVAAALTARMLHFGYIEQEDPIVPARWYQYAEPFRYSADFTAEGPLAASVPANGTRSLPVNTDPDADFQIQKLTLVCDGEFKLQVKNSDRRTEWFNKAVHAFLLGARTLDADPPAGAWPFMLPKETPEFVSARGGLFVTVQDLSGAANRIQVIFEGRKLKPAGGVSIAPGLTRAPGLVRQ